VRIEAYELVPDSCGAGKWRGGLGIRRAYRVLSDEAFLQLRADRMKFSPYGLAGGEPALPAQNLIGECATARAMPSKLTTWLKEGDLVTHVQPGGGGYGDPRTRDPERVARDVWDGKISAAYARTHHLVVVDAASGRLDKEATQALRR
jgi:N-methylhydantoinase B